MSSISWTSTASGNWNTGADWSGGGAPGAADDVTISTSQAITVTYSSGTDAVLSLATGASDAMRFTNGTFTVNGTAALDGTVRQSGGTLVLAGAQAAMDGGLRQSGGMVDIASGALTIAGTASTLNGTIIGGTLILSAGTDSIGAGAALSVAALDLTGAQVKLGGNLAQAGVFDITGGTLATGGNTLTLSGNSGLTGGLIRGSGSVLLGGISEIGGFAFAGSESVTNTGGLDQTGPVDFGSTGTDRISFTNAASGMWRVDGAQAVAGNTHTALLNQGNLIVAAGAGTALFEAGLASTGTVTVQSGFLQIRGARDRLAGTVNGAGGLELSAGKVVLAAGLELAVGTVYIDGAAVRLGGRLAYAGTFEQSGGTLALGGAALMLSGYSVLSGGTITATGTLANSGTLTVDGPAAMNGGVIQNSGKLEQASDWGLNYVTIDNQAGGTFQIEDGSAIYGNSMLDNAGLILKTGTGSLQLTSLLTNTGTVSVSAGWLNIAGRSNLLGGTFNGPGGVALNYGSDTIAAGAMLAMGSLTVGGALVTLDGNASYAGLFSDVGGSVNLGNNALTLSGAAQLGSGFLGSGGTGSLVLSGQTDITGGLSAEGSMAVVNTGTITDTASWYVGYNGSDTAALQNTGTLAMGGVEIYGQAGDAIINAGIITKSLGGTGTGIIQPQLSNGGTVAVSQGALSFLGAVSGSGEFDAGAGTALYFGAAASGGTVNLGAASALTVTAAAGFGETIAGFALGNVIDLAGLSYTGTSTIFAFNAANDQLTVSNGPGSITLQFSGSYSAGSFGLFNDQGIVAIHHS